MEGREGGQQEERKIGGRILGTCSDGGKVIDVAVTISGTSAEVRSFSEKRNKKHEGGEREKACRHCRLGLPLGAATAWRARRGTNRLFSRSPKL